jgi:hypothetical protein
MNLQRQGKDLPEWAENPVSASEKTQTPVPLPAYTKNTSQASEDAVAYLHSILMPAQKAWERVDCAELSRYPRLRKLPDPWVWYHRGSSIDPMHYACALAYIVGVEVTNPAEKCTASVQSTSRLSERCIRLPSGLSQAAQKVFSKVKTCVGCRYYGYIQRRVNQCSFATGSEVQISETGLLADDESMVSADDGSSQAESANETSAPNSVPAATRTLRRRGQADRKPSETLKKDVTTVSDVLNSGEASLEMEDWEFAPGRQIAGAVAASSKI